MITSLLPYIFGGISFLLGLYLFLLAFKIYKPKQKTEEQKAKFDHCLLKFGTLIKVSSVIMIVSGAYDLIARDTNRYRIVEVKNEWTPVVKDSMIVSCMREAKNLSAKHPDLARNYCECATEKIMQAMTYEEYLKIYHNPSNEEKIKLLMPTIQSCINQISKQVDSVEQSNIKDSVSKK